MVLYVLEIAYKKVYTKTKEEQIHLLKNFEPPEKFENTWLQKLYNYARIGGTIVAADSMASNISYFQYRNNLLQIQYDTRNKIKEKGYDNNVYLDYVSKIIKSKQTQSIIYFIGGLIASGLFFSIIPVATQSHYKSNLICIRGKSKVYTPNNSNVTDKKEYLEIKIDSKTFNEVIKEMAEVYEGVFINEKSTFDIENGDINILTIIFEQSNSNNVQNNIKRFLYSLPINVFLLFIYKFDQSADIKSNQNVLNKLKKQNNTHENNILIYPQKKELKNKLIHPKEITKQDLKIIEYGNIHTNRYNKFNGNIKYLVDYIKPLYYFKKILPKFLFKHEFSPIK